MLEAGVPSRAEAVWELWKVHEEKRKNMDVGS